MFNLMIYNILNYDFDIIKLIEILCSISLALFAYAQWNIQKQQKQISLFRLRIEHYNELRKLLNLFINFYPHTYKNGIVTILLNPKKITNEDIIEYEKLCCDFKTLLDSAKYIFSNNDIYKFEHTVFDFIISKKNFYTPEEKTIWLDSCIKDYQIILDSIFEMDKLFETDLNLLSKHHREYHMGIN